MSDEKKFHLAVMRFLQHLREEGYKGSVTNEPDREVLVLTGPGSSREVSHADLLAGQFKG